MVYVTVLTLLTDSASMMAIVYLWLSVGEVDAVEVEYLKALCAGSFITTTCKQATFVHFLSVHADAFS